MNTLADLGEKEVISLLLQRVRTSAAVGPGDDAAAIDLGTQYLVVTTDVITRSSHMPDGMTDWQIGWFAAAVNFSDVAAMGARPIGLVMAYVLPRDMPWEQFETISQGVYDCCRAVGADLLGGDTKEGTGIVMAGTAIGLVDKDRILLRKGAKEGDLVAVTGPLGMSAAGYAAIRAGIDMPMAIKALLEPQPRTEQGMVLSSSGQVTSCMDITDGLAYSVGELSRQSGRGFELIWSSIPVGEGVEEVARRSGVTMDDMVLHFGGDYELLFTFAPQAKKDLERALGEHMHVIGKVQGEKNVLVRDGVAIPLDTRGYEHFVR